MITIYKAGTGSRAAASETSAAKGLRAALNRREASASPAPAAIASAAPKAPIKPKAEWSPEIGASAEAKRATARAIAVMSSEHFAGRTNLAADLLRNPKLSAGEIIGILKLAGSRTQAAQNSALDEMRAALAETRALHGGAAPTQSSSTAAIWDRAIARVAAETSQEVAQ